MSDDLSEYDIREMVALLRSIADCTIGRERPISSIEGASTVRETLSVAVLLNTLGLLNLRKDQKGRWVYSIDDVSQIYFIRSFAIFVENSFQIFRSWTEGRKDRITAANLFYGTQFLHYMERERIEAQNDPEPLRDEVVVKAVIKANVRYRKDPMYLMEYDTGPEQYKLLGGLVESVDANYRRALSREIDEETPGIDLTLGEDYDLRHLSKFENDVVSYTHGGYAEYDIHYYAVDFDDDVQLTLSDKNAWVTQSEIEAGESADGHDIFPIEDNVLSLLARQPASIDLSPPIDPVIFVRNYWQEIAGVLSTLSFALVVWRTFYL